MGDNLCECECVSGQAESQEAQGDRGVGGMTLDDATRKALMDAVIQNVKAPPDGFWREVRQVLEGAFFQLLMIANKLEAGDE